MVDPLNRTPEQLRGDEPVSKGKLYYNYQTDEIVMFDRYSSEWGGGEIVEGRCVEAVFTVNKYHFLFLGYNDKRLIISKNHMLQYDSTDCAPQICEGILKKVRKHEFFDGYFGKMFLKRLPDVLNYMLPEVYYG